MNKIKTFFNEMLTEGNPKSSRRFVTLIVSGIFIITCITVLVLLVSLFLSTARLQGINIEALKAVVSLIQDVLKYEVFIIVAGLFVTTIAGRMQIFSTLFKKDTWTDTFNQGNREGENLPPQ